MPNQAKIDQVTQVATDLQNAKSAALIQYQGLTAANVSQLRAAVKTKGGRLEVFKNSLITRALLKMGISLPETLAGPTAIAFCNTDEVAPLKEIDQVNKAKEKTSFKYGIYGGRLLSFDELNRFLTLPSKSALIAQLLAGLQNPLQRLVYSLRYNQTRLALALKAVADKKSL